MAITALERVSQLVDRRRELLRLLDEKPAPLVRRSLKRELRVVSREARRMVSALTGLVPRGDIQNAVLGSL